MTVSVGVMQEGDECQYQTLVGGCSGAAAADPVTSLCFISVSLYCHILNISVNRLRPAWHINMLKVICMFYKRFLFTSDSCLGKLFDNFFFSKSAEMLNYFASKQPDILVF